MRCGESDCRTVLCKVSMEERKEGKKQEERGGTKEKVEGRRRSRLDPRTLDYDLSKRQMLCLRASLSSHSEHH